MNKPTYSTQSTREVGIFLDSVKDRLANGENGQVILDAIKNEPGMSAPKPLATVLGDVGSEREVKVLDAIAGGVDHYTREHGAAPTADVVEAALQQGHAAFLGIDHRGQVLLDSATSQHHDQMSLQSNRAVVAVISAIAEAIPFASYLPVDIASNQAKLAILSHQAEGAFGDYAAGGLMDGISAGNVFASSSRFVRFNIAAEPMNSKFTATNDANDLGYCDAGGVGVPVLRGRTIIYVNGIPACTDAPSGNAANSPISGSARIGATDYAISGYVTVATGVIQITDVTPNLPAGTEVTAQAFIDYEASPALIPSVIVRADVYDLFANPWRVMTGISIDAVGQIRNELGLDAESEALMAIRSQMALERHYQALRMAYNLGKNNLVPYDFDYSNQILQKSRADIWQDFGSVISNADQQMCNDTMDHGITHLYVPAWIASQMESLPRDLFEPSGITKRPSIYRVGRLFGKYEVYYAPKGPSQAADLTTAEVIAIGRSSQVARCPIVLGDAVSPTFLPLGMQNNLKSQSAMYARDFTVANPHRPSALGCARITMTNLK